MEEENPTQRTVAKLAAVHAKHLKPEACGSSHQVRLVKGRPSGSMQKPCKFEGFQTFSKTGLGGLRGP